MRALYEWVGFRYGARAAAAQREAHDRASLEQRSWRLLRASTKLKCVKGPCEIADLKRRLTVTSRPHGKDDGHQRLQDGVSEDGRWSLIKMVNLQVNRLQDGCSGDEMRNFIRELKRQ